MENTDKTYAGYYIRRIEDSEIGFKPMRGGRGSGKITGLVNAIGDLSKVIISSFSCFKVCKIYSFLTRFSPSEKRLLYFAKQGFSV